MYLPVYGYDAEVRFMHESTHKALLELRSYEVRKR
jgi:hypothetical protein